MVRLLLSKFIPTFTNCNGGKRLFLDASISVMSDIEKGTIFKVTWV